MPPGCCSSSRRLESSQLAGTAAGHAGGLRHCSAGTLAGGGECILGEWMVSGLLALLGGPLLFVCPRQALSRGACTYPALQCPVGEPGSAGSFPTAWRCPPHLQPFRTNPEQSSQVLPGQEEATRASLPAQAVCFS